MSTYNKDIIIIIIVVLLIANLLFAKLNSVKPLHVDTLLELNTTNL